MDPDPDPGGPKTCGSGSGSPTLLCALLIYGTVSPVPVLMTENIVSAFRIYISSLYTYCRNPVDLEAVMG